MKKLVFAATTLAVTMLLASCGQKPGSPVVTNEGVAPVLFGASIAELPPQVPALYDTIEVIHVDAEYNELDGEVPAYDYLSFKLQGEEMLTTNYSSDKNVIEGICIKSPKITYKGIGAGTPISAALDAGAKLQIAGCYASCGFYARLLLDDIQFDFNWFNGKGFSDAGAKKLCQMDELPDWTDTSFTASDFQPDAVLECISL